MAINLKGFLTLCDEKYISHPGEKAIRSSLDQHCLGSAKQYFLHSNFIGKRTTIGGRNEQVCKAAICIPNSVIPEKCMDYFKTGAVASMELISECSSNDYCRSDYDYRGYFE